MPEHRAPLAGLRGAATRLLLLDAVDFGLQPGTTVEKDSTGIPAYLSAHKMSLHQNSFSEVLALAELKDCLPEEIRLIGAQPLDMTYGNTLSPLLLSRLDTLVDMALHQLQAWGEPGRPACPESVFQNPEISLERYVPLPALSVLHADPKSGERKTLPALFHACSNTNGAHGGSATALVQEVSVPHTDRSAVTKPSFPALSASGHSFHPTGMRHKNIR